MSTRQQDKAAAANHLMKSTHNGMNSRVIITCHCGDKIIGTGSTRQEQMISAEKLMAEHRAKKMRAA